MHSTRDSVTGVPRAEIARGFRHQLLQPPVHHRGGDDQAAGAHQQLLRGPVARADHPARALAHKRGLHHARGGDEEPAGIRREGRAARGAHAQDEGRQAPLSHPPDTQDAGVLASARAGLREAGGRDSGRD